MKLSKSEIDELREIFNDILDYEFGDIDPLTYKVPDEDTCLHIAALLGNVRTMDLLLRGGVDVNSIGDIGFTPLHYVARSDRLVLT